MSIKSKYVNTIEKLSIQSKNVIPNAVCHPELVSGSILNYEPNP